MGDLSDWLIALVPLRVWLALAALVGGIVGTAWLISKLGG
jgi:hypothetical protein